MIKFYDGEEIKWLFAHGQCYFVHVIDKLCIGPDILGTYPLGNFDLIFNGGGGGGAVYP